MGACWSVCTMLSLARFAVAIWLARATIFSLCFDKSTATNTCLYIFLTAILNLHFYYFNEIALAMRQYSATVSSCARAPGLIPAILSVSGSNNRFRLLSKVFRR